ncbi:MAG TPA: hypothetical protein VII01_00440 [Solirubrobacteraceae bacterium]
MHLGDGPVSHHVPARAGDLGQEAILVRHGPRRAEHHTLDRASGLGVGIALAGSGWLDPSFGTGGTTVFERPTSTCPTEAGPASGGKIVAVSTSGGVITVTRLLPNGAPDPTFDGDGTRSAHAGLNRVALSGRLRGKALPPGRYQVSFTAVDSAGVSSPKMLSFTIVRR